MDGVDRVDGVDGVDRVDPVDWIGRCHHGPWVRVSLPLRLLSPPGPLRPLFLSVSLW